MFAFDRVHLLQVTSFWPARVWFADLVSLLDDPHPEDLLFQVRGTILHYWPVMETLGLAPELIDYDLLAEVKETILNARAPSNRKLDSLKCQLF